MLRFGDLLTKPKEEGGSDLGTLNASLVIAALFFVAFGVEMYTRPKAKKPKERQNNVEDLEAEKEDVEAENERRQVQTIVKVAMNAFSIFL